MNGHAVDGCRVDHHGQRTGKGSGLEGLEILLAQHLRRQVRRGTVLTRPGSTIGKIVLRARSYMILVDMVGIVALITLDFCFHHTAVHDGILAEALPHAGPAGITAQVHHGVVHPRTVARTTLVCRYLCTCTCQFRVERCTDVDRLGEQRTTGRIGHAVVVVQSVDIGNAEVFHRLLLNEWYPLLPLFHAGGTGTGGIQDGAHLPFRDQRVEHHLVQLPHPLRITFIDIYGVAAQLVNDLLVRHLQHGVDVRLWTSVLLQHRLHLLAVYLCVLYRHLADDVEVQLQHLSDLLVQRHLGKGFLNLGF